jgi:outer membrane protein assembly factor BamB
MTSVLITGARGQLGSDLVAGGVIIAESGFTELACTGLDEWRDDPADYRDQLAEWVAADVLLHCLNPDTGEVFWPHDTEARIWGSPLLADGKVYLGNEQGDLTIFAASKEKKVINKINFDGAVYSTPIAANQTLFIATDKWLYAIGGTSK